MIRKIYPLIFCVLLSLNNFAQVGNLYKIDTIKTKFNDVFVFYHYKTRTDSVYIKDPTSDYTLIRTEPMFYEIEIRMVEHNLKTNASYWIVLTGKCEKRQKIYISKKIDSHFYENKSMFHLTSYCERKPVIKRTFKKRVKTLK
jgi:hypothetical protein